jgi:hypothetical protein
MDYGVLIIICFTITINVAMICNAVVAAKGRK